MKSTKNKTSFVLSYVVAALCLSQWQILPALADDEKVMADLEKAQSLFGQRSSSAPHIIEEVLSHLKNLEGQTDDPDLKYEIYVLESRAYYWKGTHGKNKEEKLDSFVKGQEKGNKAIRENEYLPDAYYYAGINLARWGKEVGVDKAFFKLNELEKYMNDTMSRYQKDGKDGKAFDGYGPLRVLGKVQTELPWLLGGRHAKAIEYLEKAYKETNKNPNTPHYPINTVYLAEALISGNTKSERKQAKEILEELLSHDRATYNPARVPECMDEFQEAESLLEKLLEDLKK